MQHDCLFINGVQVSIDPQHLILEFIGDAIGYFGVRLQLIDGYLR
jgi:hypothetical protein